MRLEANEFAIPQRGEMLSLTTISVKADFTGGVFWAKERGATEYAMDTRPKRQRAADHRPAERASSADLAGLALEQTGSLQLGTLDVHLG